MEVEVDVRERIMVITLNRPAKRNALTPTMNGLLRDAFGQFADDPQLWVAVLAGNGPDFCAGVDLAAHRLGGAPATDARHVTNARHGGITRDFECWKPIVAAVQGNCLGGGLELALCADIRIADTTTRLGSPEVKWGLMQGAGATQRLPRFVPFGVALEMLFTGDPISAERAERIGLVNEVCAAGQALKRAMEMAARIAERAPLGVRRAKEAAYRGIDQTLADGMRTEELLSRTLAGTADLAEGQQAFVDQRQAKWTGR